MYNSTQEGELWSYYLQMSVSVICFIQFPTFREQRKRLLLYPKRASTALLFARCLARFISRLFHLLAPFKRRLPAVHYVLLRGGPHLQEQAKNEQPPAEVKPPTKGKSVEITLKVVLLIPNIISVMRLAW